MTLFSGSSLGAAVGSAPYRRNLSEAPAGGGGNSGSVNGDCVQAPTRPTAKQRHSMTGSTPKAGESSRHSTFGSLFRSRAEAPPSAARPAARPAQIATPAVASSSARPMSMYAGQPPYPQARPMYAPNSAPYATGSTLQQQQQPQPYYRPPPQHQLPQQQPSSAPAAYPQHVGTPQYRPQHAYPQQQYHQPVPQQHSQPQHQQRPASTAYAPTAGPQYIASPATTPHGELPPALPVSESNAELEAALQASQTSAEQEKRRREATEREETEHYLALHESEQQERARREAEEEDMVRQVIEASEREEREAQLRREARRKEEELQQQVLLEESRQAALREEEARMQREHADLLARSRHEAEEEDRNRRSAKDKQTAMEQAAVEQSLREMEEEWRRRDEAERAMADHIHKGGELGSASYWQHLDQKKAYSLALKMDKSMTISNPSAQRQGNAVAGPSRVSRPLPPTPGLAALQAGIERQSSSTKSSSTLQPARDDEEDDEVWVPSDDEELMGTIGLGKRSDDDDGEEDSDKDPFSDQAEAPPTYDEVREDRPPEAPTTVPGHIRFERPVVGPSASTQPLVATVAASTRAEKSAAYSAAFGDSSPSSSFASSSQPPPPLTRLESQHDELPSLNSASTMPTTPSRTVSIDDSSQSHSTAHTSVRTPAADESERSTPGTPAEFQQKAMKGTDFGYCSDPFATTLDVPEDPAKARFPNAIQLRKCTVDGALADATCFFVVRAPSWKALLRALAWYGNTRIVAGPEEVVDHPRGVPLRVEVEFVTPSSSSSATMPYAYVSACLSLAVPSLADAASGSLGEALKRGSRALDASSLRQGSTRRVIALPSQAPTLPIDMVRLAQHMHRAHIFSAACPTTGATALHSPRDLHHAIERHDVGYVAKLQRRRREAARAGGDTLQTPISTTVDTGTTNSASGSNGRRTSNGAGLEDAEGDELDDGEDDDELDGQGDALDAGAVEIVDGDDRDSSRMARMRARVRRRLAKRSGDARAADQDLESWITPFDMTQHG